MGEITRVGIDLGKHVYQVCGMDGSGAVVLQRQVKAPRLMELMAQVKPCLVGMEASCGAHHWVERLRELGHEVRMMSPQFVRPYVKSNKSDYHDAEAICEAVSRPTMRFVPYKTKQRRALQQVHRSRETMVAMRTQLANQLRGFLREYGIVLPQGLAVIKREVPAIATDEERDLPGAFRALLCMQHRALMQVDEQVADLTAKLERESQENPLCERLMSIPGIGPLVSTALVASVGSGWAFSSGSQMSAFLGLVPRQESTGGRVVLRGISKRGDRYMRALLIHGARAVLRTAHKGERTRLKEWALDVKRRRGANVATVAAANKLARIAWAVLRHDECYSDERHVGGRTKASRAAA